MEEEWPKAQALREATGKRERDENARLLEGVREDRNAQMPAGEGTGFR